MRVRKSDSECQDEQMTESRSPLPTTRPEPSVRGRLLATLLSQNTLVQPEVALTRATQFLLGLPGAANALDGLVAQSGLVPAPGGFWLTEVRGDEGGRTDLEYRWGASETVHVIVEAKVGHTLDGDQVDAYRARLGAEGLLVVLVPASRRSEGERVVQDLRHTYGRVGDRVQVALWTWNEVADALDAALPEQQPDAAQLRGLVETAGALDIRPFSEAELVTSDRSRFDDLWSVLDRASFLGFPSQSGGYFEKWRSYPIGDFDADFFVGIGRTGRTEPEPWCWVRMSRRAHLGLAQQEAIKVHRADAKQDGDSLLVPLVLEPDLSGYELTESLRAQLVVIASQVRDGLRKELAKTDWAEVQADEKVTAPLHGMRAFTAAELLDSDPSRRQDLQSLLDQVSRHIYGGPKGRWNSGYPAFETRKWIKIDPYHSHLSIGLARTDDAPAPRPWVWLSIEEITPQSDVVLRALEEAFPGQVVKIPKGWGLPLSITAGQNGVEAFASAVAQIENALKAIRGALQGHN